MRDIPFGRGKRPCVEAGFDDVVERTGGDYVSSSTDFYAGWYAPADASSTPDTLELSE